MTSTNPVDLWNFNTFDTELQDSLAKNADLIRSYFYTKREIGADMRINRYETRFIAFRDDFFPALESKVIRAWHYTRLTDAEVDSMRRNGIELSTLGSFRGKLDALVAAGDITAPQADEIYGASRFNNQKTDVRSDQFWMVSHPVALDDNGVVPLLAHWGGEAARPKCHTASLKQLLQGIGVPRVIEISVPLCLTTKALCAADAIISTFGRTLGLVPEKISFDCCVKESLSPASILRVNSESDETFAKIARGYPEDFVDVDIEQCEPL